MIAEAIRMEDFLESSPPNVHYFFMAYSSKEGVDDAEAHVNTMKARVDSELEKLGVIYGKATECHLGSVFGAEWTRIGM